MPRSKSHTPPYLLHAASGQARVFICRRPHYLGKYGSPESFARYHDLLESYRANGYKLPDHDDGLDEPEPAHLLDDIIRVRHVVAEFRTRKLPKYSGGQAGKWRNLCSLLIDKHADLPAAEFGPRRLSAIRDEMIAAENCRRYINERVFGVSKHWPGHGG